MASLFSLAGQTALVTGGTRGIGASMAIALAEAGADIVLVQRDRSNTSTKTLIETIGRQCTIVLANLASPSDVSALTSHVLQLVPRIHILLNCAGIQRRHPSHQFPISEWEEVIQVNLSTVFTISRDVGAHMLTQPPFDPSSATSTTRPSTATGTGSDSTTAPSPSARRGTIINLGSLLSFQGGITVPAYAASKGGVAQLTKALSNEWAGRGVTVNAIAPGYVATDMNEALIADEKRAGEILGRIPIGRWGRPEDFKGPVVFLASAAASYISGEMLTIDGGWMGR